MTTTALTVKRYTSASLFLKETEPFLRRNEFPNIFIILMAQEEIALEKKQGKSNSYSSAVWDDQNQLVFALLNIKNNTFLYGSLTQNMEAIDLLVEDLLASGTHASVSFVHAFQPTIGRLYELLQTRSGLCFKITDQVWACESQKVNWSPRLLAIARDEKTELKMATMDDLPLLTDWTLGFFTHMTTEDGMDASTLPDPQESAREAIGNKFAFILHIDGNPVSMCWKKRPTETACSLAFVYTPKEHRNKGYGAVCVGLLTEKLLQNRRSVNLFVIKERDPVKNMYAGIGYQMVGESARLRIAE